MTAAVTFRAARAVPTTMPTLAALLEAAADAGYVIRLKRQRGVWCATLAPSFTTDDADVLLASAARPGEALLGLVAQLPKETTP